MPWGLKRYYGTGGLHFITGRYYQRRPLLEPERHGVIPNARAFTSGRRDLACTKL